MKKATIALAVIFFIEIIFAYYIVSFAFTKYKDNKMQNLYFDDTFYYGGEYFDYDEDYALNVAVIIYNRVYNQQFTKNDFYIDSADFTNDNKNVWHIYLKKNYDEFIAKLSNDMMYDKSQGLYIDKNCGAIIANCGEKY